MRRSASLLPVYREESEAEGGEVNEPNMQPDPATSTFKLLLFSHAKKRELHAAQEYTPPKLHLLGSSATNSAMSSNTANLF